MGLPLCLKRQVRHFDYEMGAVGAFISFCHRTSLVKMTKKLAPKPPVHIECVVIGIEINIGHNQKCLHRFAVNISVFRNYFTLVS